MPSPPNPFLLWAIAVAALLLWAILLWAEWQRLGQKRALLRAPLLLAALAALYLAWWRPHYRVAGEGTSLLLNGEAPRQLDSLLKVYPAARVWSLQPHPDYPLLPGLSYLPHYLPAGSTLFLLGDGLRPEELAYTRDYSLTYIPGPVRGGLQQLHYRQRAGLGDSLQLWGHWQPQGPGEKLQLSLGALALDSVAAATPPAGQSFRLGTPLFVAGQQRYHLYRLEQGGDTLDQYPLPLQVAPPRPLQLALLTAYPDPESKYLKEYLAQQGYKLQYSARLAPGKLVQEWLNMPRTPLRISAEGLKDYDILIMSTGYWAGLPPGQQQEIARQVEQRGLGLLMYPDAERNSLRWQENSLHFSTETLTDTLLLGGIRLPLEYRRLEKGLEGWEELSAAAIRGPAMASRRWGMGMLAVGGGQQTYRLLLQGQTAAYRAYWHYLLEAAMPAPKNSTFLTQAGEASEREPLHLRLHSNDSLPTFKLFDARQQPHSPLLWQSPRWLGQWEILVPALTGGWYGAASADDTLSVRVGQQPSSLQRAFWQAATRQQAVREAAPVAKTIYSRKVIPLGWFYVVFLISMGGLWLERKLMG
jgi:hypothetical protein